MPSAAVAKAKRKIYDSPDELAIVHRAKRGDEAAFTTLYQHHHNRIKVTINKIVQNEDTADWLTNIALTKVWQHLAEFDEQSKFTTWVTRIAINEALMHVRREKSQQRQAESTSLDAMLVIGGVNGEKVDPPLHNHRVLAIRDLSLEGIADRQVLERAILRVPLKYREVLRLRFWDGLSLDEIRSTLGLRKRRLSAIKTRLLRGRKMLMEQVDAIS